MLELPIPYIKQLCVNVVDQQIKLIGKNNIPSLCCNFGVAAQKNILYVHKYFLYF